MNKSLARMTAVAAVLAASLVMTLIVCSAALAVSSDANAPVASGAPTPGTPKTYYFTWYDSTPANGMAGDWIVIGNLEDTSASAQVYFGNEAAPRESLTIASHDRAVVSWPNTIGGPVRVVSPGGATLVVTQRVLYGNTFNEVAAIEAANLDSAYNFTWYDSRPENGMRGNWILVANAGTVSASVDVYAGGASMGSYTIAPGDKITPQYPNYMNGPVRVTSTNGQPLIVSQRVLWGGSFNEVMGMPDRNLDTVYNFTWYDMTRSTGMAGNWILISNSNDATVHAQVYVGPGAVPRGTYAIGPHQSVTPVYPELRDGPVRVICTDCSGSQKIMVSQRIIYKDSFEEVQGTPPAGLTEREFFGWYDFTAANSMRGDWLLIANVGLLDTTVDVFIGNSATPHATYNIAAGDRVTPQFPEVMGGPIRVVSRNNQPLMVSQRTIYKDSFNELLGLTKVDVGAPAAAGPDMHLSKLNVYWKDLSDFNNHLLSVDMRVSNPGAGNAAGTTITGITGTNGVTTATTVPIALGDVSAGGGYANFTARLNVPAGVTGFNLHVTAKCQDSGGAWYYFPSV
ncbi:MAG: hypothetical protein ACYC6Z_09850 [Thermoleophilia bacterium]